MTELLPGPLEVIAQEIRVHARHAGAGQTSELIVLALDAAGWAVVPKVPTEAMLAATTACDCDHYVDPSAGVHPDQWQAMIDAALK